MGSSRRHVLELAGVSTLTGVSALAGCVDRASRPDQSSVSGSRSEDPDNGDSESDTDDRESDVADVDHPACPQYENVDRTVCYQTADLSADPVILEPSARTVEDGSEIEFTLKNDGAERFASNFYNWRLDKYVDGEWYRVAPLMYNEPLMFVEPGGSHTWTVTPDNDGIEDVDRFDGENGTESLTLTGLGGGIYAFRARGWFEDARSEETLALAATFELEGEPLDLTPTTAIESVEWEDHAGCDVLVARSNRGEDTEYQRLGAYELAVVDEPDADARSVIAEQVIRDDHLRDTIALACEHEATRVRLEEYNATRPIFGANTDGIYEYRGTYYRVCTRELEGEDE